MSSDPQPAFDKAEERGHQALGNTHDARNVPWPTKTRISDARVRTVEYFGWLDFVAGAPDPAGYLLDGGAVPSSSPLG